MVLIYEDFHFRNLTLTMIRMRGRDITNGSEITGETIKDQVIFDFLYVSTSFVVLCMAFNTVVKQPFFSKQFFSFLFL